MATVGHLVYRLAVEDSALRTGLQRAAQLMTTSGTTHGRAFSRGLASGISSGAGAIGTAMESAVRSGASSTTSAAASVGRGISSSVAGSISSGVSSGMSGATSAVRSGGGVMSTILQGAFLGVGAILAQSVINGVGASIGAIKNLGSEIIKIGGEARQNQIALTSALDNNVAKAANLQKQIQSLSAATPPTPADSINSSNWFTGSITSLEGAGRHTAFLERYEVSEPVPEPGEWLGIVATGAMVGGIVYKRRKK